MKIKNINMLFVDWNKIIKVQNSDTNTTKIKRIHSKLPLRIRMGKFYTEQEIVEYRNKSLRRRLP